MSVVADIEELFNELDSEIQWAKTKAGSLDSDYANEIELDFSEMYSQIDDVENKFSDLKDRVSDLIENLKDLI